MSTRISTRKVRETMWAMGMPCNDARYVNIMRSLIKAGLNEDQAYAIVKESYNAANGFTFNLTEGTQIHRATRRKNAANHPNGKDAEDIKAEMEGRASRWGTPEFHAQ